MILDCIPKTIEIPRYEIQLPTLAQNIQDMQDHAPICKSMGLWPLERALLWWIKMCWKPKGDVELKLVTKGFFTTIFNKIEDRQRILHNGPYFFNSIGLYIHLWK